MNPQPAAEGRTALHRRDIRFAVDNWTNPLTQSELAVDSPYNTRLNAGLPPGPIGSPGIDSIEAAANPANTDFLSTWSSRTHAASTS